MNLLKYLRISFGTLCLCVALLFPCREHFAQSNQSGNIETIIADIVDHIPGMGTNSFVIPTSSQISAFESIFTNMNSMNFSTIQSLLTPYGYTITRFVHLPTTDTFYLLKENYPIQRGWGTYIFNYKTVNNLAIETPHPLWDRYTWSMGIKVFLGAKARWFSMAGTHRYSNSDSSSDMAHVTLSIFHTAHRINANSTAVQVHGFDSSSPSYNGYPDAVISCGNIYPSSIYYTLKDNYALQGFTAGVFSISTSTQLSQLGATTNTQGKWSNSNNKKFVHIEHDQPLRFDTTNLRKAANAIIQTFGITTGISPELKIEPTYNLISAYPNPFNPSTIISVSIASSEDISLSIKDILGRTLQVVYAGYLTAGSHTFRFGATSFSSGIYICTLASKKTFLTTKLILLK